jgi:hypothetical protein
MSALPRRALVASVAALALGVAPAAASAAEATGPVQQAAAFQAGELVKNRMPSTYVDGPDWGLTVDTLYMLAATGKPAKARAIGRVLAKKAGAYTTSSFGDTTYESAGATAKVLLASQVVGQGKTLGGTDYRKALLSFAQPNGRLADRNSDGTDYSNTFGQAIGVIALSRSGRAPQATVRFLLRQQCAAGFFTLTPTGNQTCDKAGSPASVDATAYAVQALYAATKQGKATVPARRITKAVRWLAGVQRANGSFGSDDAIRTSNANSTGLAAQALADAGRTKAVKKARAWIRTVQITRGSAGQAAEAIGAIAYDRAALKNARRDGISDIDQFRRATAMGAFALAPKPLRTLKAR